jgi:hypothetical protein
MQTLVQQLISDPVAFSYTSTVNKETEENIHNTDQDFVKTVQQLISKPNWFFL